MMFADQISNTEATRDQQDADNDFYAAALKEMVGLGIDVARIIHQQIVAQAIDSPHTPVGESASLAFERVSRAIRRTIMLARRLQQQAPLRHATTGEPTSSEAETNAKSTTRELVEPREPGERPERSERPERPEPLDQPDSPDSPDRLEDFGDHPTHHIFAEIRKDLGLPPIVPPSLAEHARSATIGEATAETAPSGSRLSWQRPSANPRPQPHPGQRPRIPQTHHPTG